MSIKRGGQKSGKFQVGDAVLSKKVGARAGFVGVIVEIMPGYFHVEDDAGALWHRTRSELSRVANDDLPASSQAEAA